MRIIIPQKYSLSIQHMQVHRVSGLAPRNVSVQSCLVDETMKGSLLPNERLLFGDSRGSIYVVDPSQAMAFESWFCPTN